MQRNNSIFIYFFFAELLQCGPICLWTSNHALQFPFFKEMLKHVKCDCIEFYYKDIGGLSSFAMYKYGFCHTVLSLLQNCPLFHPYFHCINTIIFFFFFHGCIQPPVFALKVYDFHFFCSTAIL